MLGKVVLSLVALAMGATVWGVRSDALAVPERWNPRAPLDVNAPPGFLTRTKLARLSKDPELCERVLATTDLEYEELTDRNTGAGCGFRNAVRIDRTQSDVNDSFSLTCPAAVSLAMWEKHVLQPAAQTHFGQTVERIEHFGSYSCRNVYGRKTGRRSRHATAEAFDVAGFVLADKKRIRVINDWQGDAQASAFLREVRDGACSFFDGVLSPDYNAAHRDHFHFERGGYRICR